MNIVLLEEQAGREHSFSKPIVTFGRDADVCDIAFENVRYPMVSRRHAELRLGEGEWLLVDLGSSYGTFLNGQRISGVTPISLGSAIQFGVDGPLFRVIWFETDGTPAPTPSKPSPENPSIGQSVPKQPAPQRPPEPGPQNPVRQTSQPIAPLPPQQIKPVAPLPPRPAASGPARLEFADGSHPAVVLGQGGLSIGRDPSCDIKFDTSSATVSRRHAEIRYQSGIYSIVDNNSFNGTLVNGQRITAAVPLYHGDQVQFGVGGPILKFDSPKDQAPVGADLAGQRSRSSIPSVPDSGSPKTIIFNNKAVSPPSVEQQNSGEPQLIFSVAFAQKNELTIGRDETCDITLDGLQISKRHAKLVRSGTDILIEDAGSTNGVYVNGGRVSKQVLRPEDSALIGSFVIRVDQSGSVGVYDSRSKVRIDVVDLQQTVKDRSGRGQVKLLDGISLSIKPNEFVGVLGPSGAGKSTLLEAMNGNRPAKSGSVFINNLDLYRHRDSLKQSIGYVPQDDIIHKELSVYRTLYYVAKLRLSRDVSTAEVRQIVDEVLDVTGLAERRDVPVHQLSGGQRKRVSMAVELITKPSMIFLDEPTSGLDPSTEEKIMKLFRQIAESGRTVVMTTHAMENVRLFDKIVVLMRGKLAFYGTPNEALEFLGARSFKDLYDKLEEAVESGVDQQGEDRRAEITEKAAENWRQKFKGSTLYRTNVEKPLSELAEMPQGRRNKKRRLGIFGSIRQWFTLSRRYLEVLLKDKLNLFILFAQAPAIALLTALVTGSTGTRDFVYFVVALVSFWFGTSVAAREIVREKPVYRRERKVNLGILPYVGSKLWVLGWIVGLQCVMLFVPLKFLDLVDVIKMPGEVLGIPQFIAMLLTAAVGISLGLLISAVVRTSEMATSLVPLILIPQILFSGIVGVPGTVDKVAGMLMPAAWSFDTMKRFSTLDTLEEEGADPDGKTHGLGLYKSIDADNEKTMDDFKAALEKYKKEAKAFQNDPMGNPTPIEPEFPVVKKIPEDVSDYVTFLHPWMNEFVNQLVLMIMCGILVFLTLVILRVKDIL